LTDRFIGRSITIANTYVLSSRKNRIVTLCVVLENTSWHTTWFARVLNFGPLARLART